MIILCGGRGASLKKGSGIFSGQVKEGGAKLAPADFVARVNKMYQRNKQTFNSTLNEFRRQFATAKKESAIVVDDNGSPSVLRHGWAHHVTLAAGEADGKILIHNHPSDSAFSRVDLQGWANGAEKGVVASGKSGDWIVVKGKNFNGEGFMKAMNSAKYSTSSTATTATGRINAYNKAVKSFLQKNQKQYGYKFTYRKSK